MKTSLFPHFSRIITARVWVTLGKTMLWSAFASLLMVNAFLRLYNTPQYWTLVLTSLAQPTNAELHVDLAQALWKQGLPKQSRTELSIAQQYTQIAKPALSPNILGATRSPADTLMLWNQESIQLENEYTFWKRVVEEKPQYKDAYVALGLVSYRLYRNSDAYMYLKKALAIDPNDTNAQHVLYVLGTQ